MATDGRRADPAVALSGPPTGPGRPGPALSGPPTGPSRPGLADLLFAEGWRFDFSQAAKILELLAPEATPAGEGPEPGEEPVRFRSRMGLDFPASEVAAVAHPGTGGPPEMTVNLIALAGVMGPLPPAVSELVIERAWHKDTAFADFLDLFHHRLVSLLWRARKRRRPTLELAPARNAYARCGLALLGLGTGGLAGRMGVPDRSLLVYAGLAAQRPRSAVGLRVLLADHFEVPVAVRPFAGRWLEAADDERTRLGLAGRLAAGGDGALLGARVWDQGAGFSLHFGPLSLHQFLDFLPPGCGFKALTELVRFWAGRQLAWTVRLALKAAEVPECRLGVGSRLGWTSWLQTREAVADGQVVVREHAG
jgi:type VI secretion system protein ImpH